MFAKDATCLSLSATVGLASNTTLQMLKQSLPKRPAPVCAQQHPDTDLPELHSSCS